MPYLAGFYHCINIPLLWNSAERQGYESDRWLTVIETFNYTAIRLNQLIHLRVRDIDLVHNTLFIQSEGSKSHYEHIVPIASRLRPYLEHLFEETITKGIRADDQLFNINRFCRRTLCQGKPMTENQVSELFLCQTQRCLP